MYVCALFLLWSLFFLPSLSNLLFQKESNIHRAEIQALTQLIGELEEELQESSQKAESYKQALESKVYSHVIPHILSILIPCALSHNAYIMFSPPNPYRHSTSNLWTIRLLQLTRIWRKWSRKSRRRMQNSRVPKLKSKSLSRKRYFIVVLIPDVVCDFGVLSA